MSETKKTIRVGSKNYSIYALRSLENQQEQMMALPYSLRVLLENMLRKAGAKAEGVATLLSWKECYNSKETAKLHASAIDFSPTRILMQDFTGVPAMVDLAAMRDAVHEKGGDASRVNPLIPVDLVIDHSVTVHHYGDQGSLQQNIDREYEENRERYQFLRWAQTSVKNFRVIPPGKGIVHQMNLESLAKVVWSEEDHATQEVLAYPDSLLGTDSHTTMINGLSVVGWGVGGIEAEAAMLGIPVNMLVPQVVGVELLGELSEGVTATDLVLTITEMLRKQGVVGKFVEFYGSGLKELSLADRATVANMAPEYGATIGFFPIDEETLSYLRLTGRSDEEVLLVEHYAKEQLLWAGSGSSALSPLYSDHLRFDLSQVRPSLAGPKRPQDRVLLSAVKESFEKSFMMKSSDEAVEQGKIKDGDVVIAAITSCTNTSNPSVMIAAGLVAKKARERGLTVKSWIKTSLAPGSQVVAEYLQSAGLLEDLNALGFNIVGHGCTTCIGNSGPLPEEVSLEVNQKKLAVAAVLSGNRNFEGRIHSQVRANYLASPPLVVAYALAGSVLVDLSKDALGVDRSGQQVFLSDLWPSNSEINAVMEKVLSRELFVKKRQEIFVGSKLWNELPLRASLRYEWSENSTYIKRPPFLDHHIFKQEDIKDAKILALFGDSITTDHISPAGSIKRDSPSGKYLISCGVPVENFNSYGSRRGHHEVMMRGTFANVRIKNAMVAGTEGGVTRYKGSVMTIFDAAISYANDKTPLVIMAGKEYGSGSSRDWAAKGPNLLGVRAVIAESFERIHRSNLIGMGIIPLEFLPGDSWESLKITGAESISLLGIGKLKAQAQVILAIDGMEKTRLKCRVDTESEMLQLQAGGILPFALKRFF
ncbi:MAG: aconitate hydratase AcnA [Oligoflexia bacterium]|nr:aconitate hydratase AcnA [Oligoflexia bacterium]